MTDQELKAILCKAYMMGYQDGCARPDTPDIESRSSDVADILFKSRGDYKKKIKIPNFVGLEQIIIYYLQNYKAERCVSLNQTDILLHYIWRKLLAQGKLDDYQFSSCINPSAAIRICYYNDNVLYYDDVECCIYGKTPFISNKDSKLDDTFKKIIDDFLNGVD